MSDPEVNAHVKEIMHDRTEAILDARWVERINSRHRAEKRILLLTESSFSLYQTKAFSKMPKMSRHFTWFDLQKIEMPQAKTLCLTFENDSVLFTCDSIETVLLKMISHIQEIFSLNEMPKMEIQHYNLEESEDTFRPIKRLKARIYTQRGSIPEDLIHSYMQFLRSGKDKLNIGDIAVHHFYDFILDSLYVAPHVKILEVPNSERSHWKEIGKFLAKSCYVESLITSEKIDSGFVDFLNELENSKQKILKSITFSSPKILDTDIPTIISIVQKREIENLTIIRGLHRHYFESLCDGLAKAKSLKYLAIEHVDYVEPIKIMKTLPNLEVLEATYSETELLTLFTALANLKDISIKKLNFSGNRFKSAFQKQISLPSSIDTLILNNVDFGGSSFQSLFTHLILNNPTPISLSVNSFKITDNQWQSFQNVIFQFANSSEYLNLQELYWDGNLLFPQFFAFLDKCEPLTVLSLNGCISDSDDTTIIHNLIEFISSTTSVTDLRLGGTKEKQIGKFELIQILEALTKDNKVIKRIDLHNQKLDSNLFEVLGNVLLQNRVIEYINFNGCGITDPQIFKDFFSTLLKRGKPLYFPFPYDDIYEMQNKHLITDDLINELKTESKSIYEGNTSIKTPQETIQIPQIINKPDYLGIELYINEKENSESSSDDEWALYPSQIPQIDNYEIESLLAEQYTIPKIIEKIRSH